MAFLELREVALQFHVRTGRRQVPSESILGALHGETGALLAHTQQQRIAVRALDGVSLRVDEGERVGIIGRNGSGKSTLLKVLAGIYPPTQGERLSQGRISSLFDISLGFEPDATGWENIYCRGYLQGETPRSIRGKLGAVAEFSELGEYLNLPVRLYSSGMKMRLAFAIATAIDPEILLVDECLAVGDLAFQAKATQRMREMLGRARLIIVVSHDLIGLPRLCERGVWLDRGRIRHEGPIAQVIAAYQVSSQSGAQTLTAA